MVEPFPDPKLRFAEEVLDALSAVDGLLEPGAAGKTEKGGFSELYSYAIDPAQQPGQRTLAALERDVRVQADFQRLLKNTSRYHLPEVAAASTGVLEGRKIQGCSLVFHPSRADDGQIYVIIESIADRNFLPKLLFVCHADGRSQRLALPEGRDGRVQILLERDSDIVRGLLDVNTEVYLT